ncbi:MAG TPA: DUF11 domain-containing protein [Nitriliruptorales bacterium]
MTDRRRAMMWAGMLVSLILPAVLPLAAAQAAATLTVEPLTWNVIGLDSNDVTSGPNEFLVGARVCNTGDEPAASTTAAFVWESDNPFITVVGPSTLALGSLGAGTCEDVYFLVAASRDPAAYDSTRRFRIDATADGVAAVSSPTPRELLVERLISQNRNDAISIEGPTEVFVGQTVTYDVTASTATNGYEQLQNFLPFPHAMFSIVSIEQTYTAPPGAVNDRPYADACGWDTDPTSPSYLTCVGPENFAGGKAGGDLATRYVVEVVAPGSAFLTDLIYDFSGSSYHYNADFGDPAVTVVALAPVDLELTKTVSDTAPRPGEEVTYTLTLTNDSSTAATGVEVTDSLPAGVQVLGGATDAGAFDPATGVWTVGEVAGGQTVTLTVAARVEAEGELTNVAEVTAADQPDADSTPANGDATEDDHATVTLTSGVPALEVSKAASATEVAADDTLDYVVTVTNVGVNLATEVVVTDPVPSGAAYVAGSTTVDGTAVEDAGDRPPLAGGLVVGDLQPGASVEVGYALRITGTTDEVVNTATAATPDAPTVTDTTSTTVVVGEPGGGAGSGPGTADPGGSDPTGGGDGDESPSQTDDLPRTGPNEEVLMTGVVGWLALVAGCLLLVAAHRLDRRQRIRAINVAHAAMLRAKRTGQLWSARPGP